MSDLIDPILRAAAGVLDLAYGIVPNYAIAIAMLTVLVMVVTTPLTLKSTRSMIKLQMLQPEVKRIQAEFKDDRVKQQEEMMKFYQEQQVNPLGGCLPMLVQMPVFLLLFNVIRGLTHQPGSGDGTFEPKYLAESSTLYQALDDQTEMLSFGLDLSETALGVLQDDILRGIPFLLLVLVQIGAQYFQQLQVQARNKDGAPAAIPQQQMLLRVMPVLFGIFSLNFPAALVVYWVTSSLWRIGVQAYITRSLYAGEDSLGAKAQAASAAARKAAGDGDTKTETKPAKKTKPANTAPAKAKPVQSGRVTPSGSGRQHPSSKKKKKKKR